MKTNLLERKMNEQGISKAELAKYLKLSEKRLQRRWTAFAYGTLGK